MGCANRKQRVYVKKRAVRQVVKRVIKVITFIMFRYPDHVIKHYVTTCDCCGESLENEPVVRVKTRQVFDIPPIQLEVTQHETEVKRCASCGTKTESRFPKDVQHHVQYGANVQSMVLYMMQYQLIPFARTKEFFQDFFNVSISEGTLWNIHQQFGAYLVETFEPQARNQVIKLRLFILMKQVCEVKGKRNGYIH